MTLQRRRTTSLFVLIGSLIGSLIGFLIFIFMVLLAPIVALIGYYFPWINNSAAALSFNAYDLAEWVSLHPAVRGGSVPLLAPFLLRSVLGGLALLFGVRALRLGVRWQQIAYGALAVCLAITLLPPLDFFRGAWDDPNYRQQFALTIGTLGGQGALFAIARRKPAWLRLLGMGIGVLTIASAVIGFILAQNIVSSLRIAAPFGPGLPVLAAGIGLSIVAEWWSEKKT
jgi:hypothetical protein